MNILVWNSAFESGYVIKNSRHTSLQVKPKLDFKFTDLLYGDSLQASKDIPSRVELSPNEIKKCEAWIRDFDFDNLDKPAVVVGIGDSNEFLGVGALQDFERVTLKFPGVGHHVYKPSKDSWEFVYGVTEVGEYLGNVSPVESYRCVPSAPPQKAMRWNFRESKWEKYQDLKEAKEEALDELKARIVKLANKITPYEEGQAHVFERKLAEAKKAKEVDFDAVKLEDYLFLTCDLTPEDAQKTVRDLADDIITKEQSYNTNLLALAKFRTSASFEINKCKSTQELENVLEELEVPNFSISKKLNHEIDAS